MTRFRQSLRAFVKDERGVFLAEAMITMPLMIWGFVALVVYWDVYRTVNVTQKAAYSIADLLSRQVVVTESFVDDLEQIMNFLTPGTSGSRMRITSLEFDEGTNVQAAWDGDDKYDLLFSRSPGGEVTPHTQASIQDLRSVIPTLDDLDSVIIVETWTDFEPDFDIGVLNVAPGLSDKSFDHLVVTRPRSRRVCLQGAPGCS